MVVVTPGPAEVEKFCSGVPLARQVYDAVVNLVDDLDASADPDEGPVTVKVSKSQIAFRRRTGFCWVWLPGRYLTHPAAEVVLSVALDRRDPSPRWKEVVQVGGRRWMHHLEVQALDEADPAGPPGADTEVAAWVTEAYHLAR